MPQGLCPIPNLRQFLHGILLLAIYAAFANPELARADGRPSDAELATLPDLVIGKIDVRVGNVFNTDDPAEDRWVYRLANRLHVPTRHRVIERQLLFREGDPYSPRLLRETERVLRTRRYLYDAEIRPLRVRGNRVDVEVVVRDVWTLNPSLSFSRGGGENGFEAEIQDYNVFGTGIELTLEHSGDVDRSTTRLLYKDPDVRGTRLRIDAGYGDASDGVRHHLAFGRPFFSLDTRWAAEGRVDVEERADRLWSGGEAYNRFRHDLVRAEVSWGISRGLKRGWARRLRFGARYESHHFGVALKADFPGLYDDLPDTSDQGPDFPFKLPSTPPEDRVLAYPFVELELVEDAFVEEEQLDKIGRTEDIHLGLALRARLGWSSPVFGGDQESAVYAIEASHGQRFSDRVLVRSEGSLTGRWGSDGVENLLAQASVRLAWRNFGKHLFHARARVDLGQELDGERQLLLGGDSGLRGFPLRFQSGDRRFLLTLEQRFFTDWHPLRLARVGGAVFVDVGRAWFHGPGRGPDPLAEEVLVDVGFGVRLASSRSSRGSVLHFDVAFPLNGPEGTRGVQWLVSSKETF